MRKIGLALVGLMILGGCDTRDPILPGTRNPIFDTPRVRVLDVPIEPLPEPVKDSDVSCPYVQDAQNVIWDGDKKVFTGFATSNSVGGTRTPVCAGKFVYAGLTTGELVKFNPKTRHVSWVADIYRPNAMTGGSSVLDIVVPPVVRGPDVYVGGLGDAFCRLRADTGGRRWCAPVATSHPFIVTDTVIFVMGTDGYLYALNSVDGNAYWRVSVDRAAAPVYDGKIISVDRRRFDAATGHVIHD